METKFRAHGFRAIEMTQKREKTHVSPVTSDCFTSGIRSVPDVNKHFMVKKKIPHHVAHEIYISVWIMHDNRFNAVTDDESDVRDKTCFIFSFPDDTGRDKYVQASRVYGAGGSRKGTHKSSTTSLVRDEGRKKLRDAIR